MIKSNGGVFGRNPTFNDVTVEGNLTVNGDIALGDDITVTDTLTVQGTTASTSTTTGALTVAGGVGIGGALNVGGQINAAATTTSTSTTTGALVVSGGLGVAGAIYPGGNVVMANGNGISFAATSEPSLPAVAATGIIRRTATNVSDGDSVTIGTTVYTFKTTLTPADWEVLIGADASASLTNLRHAILGTGGTPGTDYQVPNAHPTVTADAISGTNLPIRAITAGTGGNSIALSETSAELSVSAATLGGGAAAQGMTAEVLNDYEEGTWMPDIRFGALTVPTSGITYGTRLGRYTKIGRFVSLLGRVDLTNKGITTGLAAIGGLPFANGAGVHVSGNTEFAFNVTAVNQCINYISPGQAYIELGEINDSGSYSALTDADFANNSSIHINIVYATS